MRNDMGTWRAGLSVLVLAAVTAAGTGAAHADTTSVSVSGGALSVDAPAVNDVAVVTLNGSAQAAEAVFSPFSVTDARGSGEGWSLSIHATPFREWDGAAYVSGGKSLPKGSLTLAGVSVAGDGTDSAAPTALAGPHTLDDGGVTVAVAAAGTGMGRFVVTPTAALRVAVPAGAYAATYRSELSLSVTAGP